MPRRYAILDVFTDRPLAGNPLAVVLDASGLDGAAMQAIAREFNLSETVFVLPAVNPVHSAALRIFTTSYEMPFAGHPTVGTAVLLGIENAGKKAKGREMVMVLEEGVGPIRCGVSITGPKAGHAVFDAPKLAGEGGQAPSREMIAAAVGLSPSEIGFENHQPTIFGAGVSFVFVPVRDLAVIARAQPNSQAWDSGVGKHIGAYLYCRETEASGHHFHVRMFARTVGFIEDPATGSGAVAFAGVIKRFDEPTPGSHHFIIEQGFEMARPSLLSLEIDIEDGNLVACRLRGDAVVVSEGTLAV